MAHRFRSFVFLCHHCVPRQGRNMPKSASNTLTSGCLPPGSLTFSSRGLSPKLFGAVERRDHNEKKSPSSWALTPTGPWSRGPATS